jgi:hypothetical protein
LASWQYFFVSQGFILFCLILFFCGKSFAPKFIKGAPKSFFLSASFISLIKIRLVLSDSSSEKKE